MEPAAVSKVMQGLWDRIAPTYNTFAGDGMMAPATELIIAAVQRYWADRTGVRRGGTAPIGTDTCMYRLLARNYKLICCSSVSLR